MKYRNGLRVAEIFADTEYDSEKTQGPVVTFNLLRPNGEIIGYSEVVRKLFSNLEVDIRDSLVLCRWNKLHTCIMLTYAMAAFAIREHVGVILVLVRNKF